MGRQARIKRERREHREQQKQVVISGYYKKHPDIFFEHHFGIKLKWYQRFLMRLAGKFNYDEE